MTDDPVAAVRRAVALVVHEACASTAPMAQRVASAQQYLDAALTSAELRLITDDFARAMMARIRGADVVCEHWQDMFALAIDELRRLSDDGADVNWDAIYQNGAQH